MIGEASMDVLVKKTSSPSFHYNLAVLESFQRNARKAELPPGFTDSQHEVIIMGGSMGKGTGHFWSDLDVLDVTDSVLQPAQWTKTFVMDMHDEFLDLVKNNPTFSQSGSFARIANELERRKIKRKPDLASVTIEQRANKMLPIVERYGRGDGMPHLESDSVGVWSTKDEVDNIQVSINMVEDYILGKNKRFGYANQIIAILTAVPEINAYELTPGNLRQHQQKIIQTLRYAQKNDKNSFDKLYTKINKAWQQYKSQTSEKYPAFWNEIIKSRSSNTYLINSFFDFDEFPEIDQLESFLMMKD